METNFAVCIDLGPRLVMEVSRCLPVPGLMMDGKTSSLNCPLVGSFCALKSQGSRVLAAAEGSSIYVHHTCWMPQLRFLCLLQKHCRLLREAFEELLQIRMPLDMLTALHTRSYSIEDLEGTYGNRNRNYTFSKRKTKYCCGYQLPQSNPDGSFRKQYADRKAALRAHAAATSENCGAFWDVLSSPLAALACCTTPTVSGDPDDEFIVPSIRRQFSGYRHSGGHFTVSISLSRSTQIWRFQII